ncbi:MAG TPA: hypothetical protein VFZ53_04320 [Polyangiaceae bacterium]
MLVRLGFACALGVSALAIAPSALAQTEPVAGDGATLRVVDIVVVGSEADFAAIRGTVGENAFDGANVRWSRAARLERGDVFDARPPASDASVRVWIDLGDANEASFYFADREGEHFLVRTMALPGALTPLELESLAQILELSVRALLEDARVGMSRAEVDALLAREAPKPEAPPARRDIPDEPEPEHDAAHSSLFAEVFYATRLFSSEVPLVHGPGLTLAWLTESPERRTLVWVAAQYDLPRELVTPEVSVEWTTLRVQGGVGLAVPIAPSGWFAGGRLGGGAEFTSFSPRAGSASPNVELEPSGVSTVPVVSLSLEAGIPLGARAGASARVFGSFYPVRVHFDVADASGAKEVLVPHWVQPGIELGLHLR